MLQQASRRFLPPGLNASANLFAANSSLWDTWCSPTSDQENKAQSPSQSVTARSFANAADIQHISFPLSRRVVKPGLMSTPHVTQNFSNARSMSTHIPPVPEFVNLGNVAADLTTWGIASQTTTTEVMFALKVMLLVGIYGSLLFRRNIIYMFMCTEIMAMAISLHWSFFGVYHNDINGIFMFIVMLAVSATETAIGLMFTVRYYHHRATTDIEALNLLK